MDSIRRSVFLLQSCSLFELLTRIILEITFLVAIFAVPGCAEMLESVFFFKKVQAFGVSDSLGERIHIFSVRHVELIFQKWFTLSMPRPSCSLIHA